MSWGDVPFANGLTARAHNSGTAELWELEALYRVRGGLRKDGGCTQGHPAGGWPRTETNSLARLVYHNFAIKFWRKSVTMQTSIWVRWAMSKNELRRFFWKIDPTATLPQTLNISENVFGWLQSIMCWNSVTLSICDHVKSPTSSEFLPDTGVISLYFCMKATKTMIVCFLRYNIFLPMFVMVHSENKRSGCLGLDIPFRRSENTKFDLWIIMLLVSPDFSKVFLWLVFFFCFFFAR